MTIERIDQENTGNNPHAIQTLGSYAISSQAGNELEAAERAVDLLTGLDLPERLIERVKTAVAETTMNAMEHGNHFQADTPVNIWIGRSDSELIIRVSDLGSDYSHTETELPDLDAKLAGLQSPRGWGLFLIRNMVDKLEFKKDNVTHTVELRWNLVEVSNDNDAI